MASRCSFDILGMSTPLEVEKTSKIEDEGGGSVPILTGGKMFVCATATQVRYNSTMVSLIPFMIF